MKALISPQIRETTQKEVTTLSRGGRLTPIFCTAILSRKAVLYLTNTPN